MLTSTTTSCVVGTEAARHTSLRTGHGPRCAPGLSPGAMGCTAVAAVPETGVTTSRQQKGFTLIEVLAVAVLMGLFVAILVPNLFIGSERDLDQGVERVRDLLAAVGEHSVFSGELMGVYLEEERITPMRFDPAEQSFKPVSGDSRSGLGPWRLSDDLRLAWDLEATEETDDPSGTAGFGLAEVAEARLVSGEDQEDREQRPQLFFFPSGEATPARLSLTLIGSDRLPVEMRLTALSRVVVEEDELR